MVLPHAGDLTGRETSKLTWLVVEPYNVAPPPVMLVGLKAPVTIVISTINHRYWSYKPTERYLGGLTMYPSEKSWSEFVSWDDDIPFPTFHGRSGKIPMVPVTTNQSPFLS